MPFVQRITVAAALALLTLAAAADDDNIPLNWRVLGAAKRKDAVQTRALVEQGAAINARDREGETALMMWVKAQDEAMVAWLLGKGASTNQEALNQTTPLMAAAYAGNTSIMR